MTRFTESDGSRRVGALGDEPLRERPSGRVPTN
jgi:hypothetical protein